MNGVNLLSAICIATVFVNAREIKRYQQDSIKEILEDLEKDVADIKNNEEKIKETLKKSDKDVDLVDTNLRNYGRKIDQLRNPAVPKNAPVKDYIWPKGADGIVKIPYTMGPSMNRRIAAEIEKTVVYINGITCSKGPKWVKRTNEEHYIEFIMDGGCYSLLGYAEEAKQPISIDDGCESRGTISHEMLHAMGFDHEQTSPDRDNYVEVRFQNIAEGGESQFEKAKRDVWSDEHLKYDYKSIMHYKRKDFSKNGKDVIVPAKGSLYTGEFGNPDDQMTDNDKKGLNILYGCQKIPTVKPVTDGPVSGGPRTYGPGTDGPVTDEPGTYGPGTDGPVTYGPGTDGPGTDGPGTGGPWTYGPGTDDPVTDEPWTYGPGTDGPGTDGPGTDGSGTGGRGTYGPWTNGPGTDGPVTNGPWTYGPGTDGPVTDGPWIDGPGTDGPGTKWFSNGKESLAKMNKKIGMLLMRVKQIQMKLKKM